MPSSSATFPRAEVLAFTCGDPAGVGPRAALAAVRAGALPRGVSPLFVGEREVWRRAGLRPSDGPVFDTRLGLPASAPGRPDADGGRVSAASFEAALALAARGLVAGLVTAPIAKDSWAAAGYAFRDHTGRLAECAPSGSAEMVLGVPSRGLWCALATRHLSLKEAVRRLDVPAVAGAARALDEALRRLGKKRPRLALCGLNPHAGEGGLIGGEEKSVLAPAAALLRREGLRLDGPLPADSAWRLHVEGAYDGLICLYHDQALIPLKALGGLSGVNWTVGLPFARTSPAHGTGWEAARTGLIDPSATIEAARLAARFLI
ncbi:MAG TPA: 4-hydroxythreonine-4-phosphate dehydrogenase PdxA [Elusimicrobiota bacterium]|jgi:4-hydroxythreonine-4-phosphate dehydrogenase|nr:4-hydroxythreonine-4-phosphate dehydrogenase PdxA [Elusimicrobiota bacterium]